MISLLHLGRVDYATALDLQKSLVELRKQERISDVLLLLEHTPVITLGRNSQIRNLVAAPELLVQKGVEIFETDRGGDVTFHGPGQLVGYPILDLRGLAPRIGAVEYVRRLEDVLIRSCGDLGIPCERMPGFTGVWTQSDDPKKIAALGVHISRGVTSHGFALNVSTDLDYFKLIVPCGISDKQVTTIEREIDTGYRPMPSMEEVADLVSRNFGRVFHDQILWLESLDALLHTSNQSPAREARPTSSEADKIDIPLKFPRELREIHRKPGTGGGGFQSGGPEGPEGDELFLA
jgi:lipoyl(octanoyl) transferase